MSTKRDVTFLRHLFERQWLHVAGLALLLSGLWYASRHEPIRQGEFWAIDSGSWFWIAAALPVIHQVFVWICWRAELHGKHLSKLLGRHAFDVYTVSFMVLGLARVAVVVPLSIANAGTIKAAPSALRILAIVIAIPAAYLFFSVARHFGFRRAAGIDHFDDCSRHRPFVREGIFRYTSNAMYVFGPLLLWAIGLWFASVGALVIAAFNHVYIWIHYWATEKPDMKYIYGMATPRD